MRNNLFFMVVFETKIEAEKHEKTTIFLKTRKK